jgi:hypothetical protein
MHESGLIPHTAVIFIKAENMQRLPNGQVSNHPTRITPDLFSVEFTDEATSEQFIDEFMKGIREYGKNIERRLKEGNGTTKPEQAE